MTTRNSRASKRWMVAAAAAVACGSTLAISGAASAGPGAAAPVPERISGLNRFATAAAISLDQGGNDITIVNGLNFPDGLASSIYGDNILLTERDSLPAETLAELSRIDGLAPFTGINQIKVVGGTSVVSSAVFEQLSVLAEGDITRVQGADRYATALAVAADSGNSGTVILATGENFPDALAAGPLALEENAPILLNNGTTVRPDVAAFLLNPLNGVSNVVIVGGETVVPASVQTQLQSSLGLSVTRLAGSDRAATAVAIANRLQVLGDYTTGVTAVNGSSFADALAAGPFAYFEDRPIMLVEQNSIPTATANYHVGNCTTIAFITAIGGTAVISDAVVAGAVGAATCAAPAITSATLSNGTFVQSVFAIPTTAGALTVTADAGTAADGAAAMGWQVVLVQNGLPGTESVVVDPEGNDNAAYGGIPTFIMTANFPLLTNEGFVQVWNASPAAALTTAATTNNLAPVNITGAAAPGAAAIPLAALATTSGSSRATVVVTFARPVTAATPSGLYPNLNPATPPAAVGAPTVTPAVIPGAGVTTLTYVYNITNPAAIPALPNWQIRYAIGDITDAATTFTNTVAAAATLSAP